MAYIKNGGPPRGVCGAQQPTRADGVPARARCPRARAALHRARCTRTPTPTPRAGQVVDSPGFLASLLAAIAALFNGLLLL